MEELVATGDELVCMEETDVDAEVALRVLDPVLVAVVEDALDSVP